MGPNPGTVSLARSVLRIDQLSWSCQLRQQNCAAKPCGLQKEGENSYYTYHEWNVAEKELLEEVQAWF